ncbi:hypothetical protein ABK040_006688 [Willaertia magna]
MPRGRGRGRGASSSSSRRNRDPEEDEEEFQFEENGDEEEEETQPKKRKQTTKSRGKKNKNKDDEAYEEGNASQPTFGLTDDKELEALVSTFMRFCLFKDANKLPIKREDLMSNVLGEQYKKRKGLLDHIIQVGSEKFKKIFGFELIEIERHEPTLEGGLNAATQATQASQPTQTTSKRKKKTTGLWMLRLAEEGSELPFLMNKKEKRDHQYRVISNRREEFMEGNSLEQAQLGLLMVIISYIEMKKNRLTEEDLWKYLKKLNLSKGQFHPIFGQPEKLLQQFEKQFYIERNKDEIALKSLQAIGGDITTPYIYQRGTRLRKELIRPQCILHFMSDVTGVQIDKTTETEFRNNHIFDEQDDEDEAEEEEEMVYGTPTQHQIIHSQPQPIQQRSRR